MTPTDLTRAELYARSVAFAARAGNVKLAVALARRGRALAGEQWGVLLARVAEPDAPTRPDSRQESRA